MKTFSTPLQNEVDAQNANFATLYDVYLPEAISTPGGSTDTLRLTNCPGGFAFFTPDMEPEPSGTQGNAQTYTFLNIRRGQVIADAEQMGSVLQIAVGNIDEDWMTGLHGVDWENVHVVVRMVALNIASPTVDDADTLFIGTSTSDPMVSDAQLDFRFSNTLEDVEQVLPEEHQRGHCRAQFCDDLCGLPPYTPGNYKTGTCGSGSTTTRVKSSDFSEDSITWGHEGQAVTIDTVNDEIDLTAHGLGQYGDGLVRFAWSSAPTSSPQIVEGRWYYVVTFAGANSFQISETYGGSAITFSAAGSGVTIDSNPLLGTDIVNALSAGAFTGDDEDGSYPASNVRALTAGDWKWSALSKWGAADNGFYRVAAAAIGPENAALTPNITIDFGSAVSPGIWRLNAASSAYVGLSSSYDHLLRFISFFASTDGVTWEFVQHHEMPFKIIEDLGVGASSWVEIDNPPNRRYWRICIRSMWDFRVDGGARRAFTHVIAYEKTRNYWAPGWIIFDDATSTAALQGVKRKISRSYSGEIECATLPAAPASGDTFVVRRDCPRTFNGCAKKRNVNRFAGQAQSPPTLIIQ